MIHTAAARLAAAALALLVLAGLGLGARCMSVTSVSCSFSSLWGEQPALDVPYAGTRSEVIARMLELAEVGPADHVIDLGTGDGRILIAAARDRGARGEGVDLDPVLVRRAQRNAEREGVSDRVAFRTENLFATPLGRASVLTLFLLPEVNLRLRPRILGEMRPGARVVSHAFDMGDWPPDARGRAGGARVYLWIVPARVAGRWRLVHEDGGEARLAFTQHFQRIGGTVVAAGVARPLAHSRLRGARIGFVADSGAGPRRYEGLVQGDAIVPASTSATAGPPLAQGWRADRLGAAD